MVFRLASELISDNGLHGVVSEPQIVAGARLIANSEFWCSTGTDKSEVGPGAESLRMYIPSNLAEKLGLPQAVYPDLYPSLAAM